jgi:hypothetical protein
LEFKPVGGNPAAAASELSPSCSPSSQYASASFSARPHWLGALLEFAEQHNASLLQPCAQLLPAGMCGAAWAPRRMLPAAAFHPLLARMLAADARGVAAALRWVPLGDWC